MLRRPCLLFLLGLSLASTGCFNTPWERPDWSSVGGYFAARGLDLIDVFPVSVAVGYGVAADVRLTQFAGLGIGWAKEHRFGVDMHRFGPMWWEKEGGFPPFFYYRYQDYDGRETRIPGGNEYWWWEDHRFIANSWVLIPGIRGDGSAPFWPILPPYTLVPKWDWTHWRQPGRFPWQLFDMEAGLFVGVVGARVGFSPGQALDFVLGISCFDPAQDDPPGSPVLWGRPWGFPMFGEPPAPGPGGMGDHRALDPRTKPALWPEPGAPPSFPDEETQPDNTENTPNSP